MKNRINLMVLFGILLSGIVLGANVPTTPQAYYGAISGGAAIGMEITASIGSTEVGSYSLVKSGYYGNRSAASSDGKLIVCAAGESGCTIGATITFGASSGAISTTSNYTPGAITELDLTYTATAAAAAADSSAGTSGGSAVSTESLEEVAVDSYIINRLDKALPEGWEDANLKYYQVGDASTETFTENTLAGIEEAIEQHVTDTKAVAVLQELRTGFESGEKVKATVARTLTVYKINNQDTGDAVYRSQITLIITAPRDMKNMKIVEVIPKTVVKSSDDLIFTGETPKILQKDPVVQWVIDSLKKGKSLDFSYIVKKKISSIKSYTLAGGEEETAPPKEKVVEPTGEAVKEITPPEEAKKFGWLVAVLIVVVGLGVYFAYTKKKGKE